MKTSSDFWRRKGALDVIYMTGEHEPVRFGTIRDHDVDVSEPTLSTRLEELVQAGLLTREEYDRSPPHVEYTLTTEGADLYERLVPFFEWDGMELRCPGESDTGDDAVDAETRGTRESGEVETTEPSEAKTTNGDADDEPEQPESPADEQISSGTTPPFEAFDLVVDVVFRRGAVQILEMCHYHDAIRFGDIMDHLDIDSTSTVSERLEQLEDVGVVHRERYHQSPPKVEYSLTPSGEELYEGLGPVFELLGESEADVDFEGEPEADVEGEPEADVEPEAETEADVEPEPETD